MTHITFLVLLSIQNAVWKITDFGLSAEGTSRLAYSTRLARGTECYRAPEMVKDGSIVSMKSDIFALGCIIYELAFGQKVFGHDYQVFEYTFTKQRVKIHPCPEGLDGRTISYITQILHAVLEINWWKRPSAKDLLQILSCLMAEATEVSTLGKESGAIREKVRLYSNDERWKSVELKCYWYVIWPS